MKPGLRAGGEEKGRGVVARQVSGEHVFERSLAMRNMLLMMRNMLLMIRNMFLMMRNMMLMVGGGHNANDEEHDSDDEVDSVLSLLEYRTQKLENVLGTNYGSFWIITKVGQVRITL